MKKRSTGESSDSKGRGEDNPIVQARVKEFGERFKEARVKLQISQEEMARGLGIKRQTLSSWETGTTTPDVKSLLVFQELYKAKLQIDLGDLVGDARWDTGATPLSFAIRFLGTMDNMGIRNVYHDRHDALAGFYPVLQKETGSINIVCSSLMGLIRVAPQRVSALLKEKAKALHWQILMTDPEKSNLREDQEGRKTGSIKQEISESVKILTEDWGISRDSIKYYRGTPTVFMLYTRDRMLLNPYTYGAEAFKTFTLEVAKTTNTEGIYSQYVANHFERAWNSSNAVSMSAAETAKIPTRPSRT